MKSKFTQATIIIILSATLCSVGQGVSVYSHINNTAMETMIKTNKEVVLELYGLILNQCKFDLLADVISEDYTNPQGDTGSDAFGKTIRGIVTAFPDAHWKVETIISEGNSVVVKHTLTGTHKNTFQNIPPSGKSFSSDGWAFYEFSGGKIIRSNVLTDRLSFLQQIGVLPADPTSYARRLATYVYFVDKFLIPKNAIEVFTERMNYNRTFIKTLPGFVRDEVIATELENGDLSLMTIAVWESREHLDAARNRVQEEYKRINFDPEEFTKRLDIIMERQLYRGYDR